ncbi:hypothetical protein SAMN05444166_1181 [Singulisphaera sp. GP187]|uniref:CvpA family protein n=1 Tax=Singulisphaera sp. GP187 TaxID=1882752 RepID=UPI00092C55F6|nr:CvpA family protein [Singulisphaera sp. GP187]SIN83490.1 hypothetical protein SAMN05444166_1181 [Singulisphaera sp. GP187]
MEIVVNLVIVALIAGLTWALTSEGLWGAVLMFFNVLFGGIIAFNFYEPLAKLLDGTGIGWGFSDTLCLLALFIIVTFLLRLITESMAPAMVRFPSIVYQLGRLVFGFAGAVVTVAILLVALETAPVHKKILGVIDYKTQPPFGMGLDRKWLAFFQYTTGLVFAEHVPGSRDPFREYGDSKVFDPKAEWLLNHQEARPYGTESILEDAAGAGGGAAAPAAGAPGAAAPGAPGAAAPGGGKPGDIQVIGPAVGGGVVLPQ